LCDGAVRIDELITAVQRALLSCSRHKDVCGGRRPAGQAARSAAACARV